MTIINLIGRELFQWDTGRVLSITLPNHIDVKRVDFKSNSVDELISMQVSKDGSRYVTEIPNEMLQYSDRIKAYVVVAHSEGNERTIIERNFDVKPREKPLGYVKSQQEILQYEELEQRVADLEKSSGGITGETDPTVPSWAKQPNKPSYTAAEVGAMPDTTHIPTKTSDLENDEGYLKTDNVYPKKVFEHEWKGNYDIIDVTDIDYDSGILTVSSMPEQITDNVNTTVRVFPEIKVEGEKVPYKYGMMPKELMSTAAYYFALKKGDKQIILCHPTTLEEITTLTSSNVINLTRWNLYVEKKRGAAQSAVSVRNLDNAHRYRMLFYMPHSAHGCSGITFYSKDGDRYGSGYERGYVSIGVKGRDNKDVYNVLQSLQVNAYETISVRGRYYAYSDIILERYPVLLEAEVYKVNDQTFMVQSNVAYFICAGTLDDSSVFQVVNAKNSIYLQRPYKAVSFGLGNGNYMLDGARMELWDLGEIT